MKPRWFAPLLFFGVSLISFAAENVQPVPHSWSFFVPGLTPLQSGGRIKPLDSFAREIILFETGSRQFRGWEPVDLLLSWIVFPQYWEDQPLIRVAREDVRRQLGVDEKRSLFSPRELLKNPNLIQYAERMSRGIPGSEPPGAARAGPRDQELRSVFDRIETFQGLVTGQAWLLIPRPEPVAWGSLVDPHSEAKLIQNQFADVIRAYQANDESRFQRAFVLLRAAIEGEIPRFTEIFKGKVEAETIYNHLRPFQLAWVAYLLAACFWSLCFNFKETKRLRISSGLKSLALGCTAFGVLSQGVGIGLRCFVAGRPPVTNMYESVIWVSLGVMIFAWILYWIHRQEIIFAVGTALATLGLIAGDSAPAVLDPSIRPLVPVLRSNYWLTVHVLTITLGYAAFALTLGLSNMSLFYFLRRKGSQKIANLNQLTYRAMQFGVVLIAAGTILGGIWADYSWGRFWGWDPKEVWALITLLCYLVILHGRYTNWMGQFGFAVGAAVSFMSVVMAWYGVNFILGAGLHSYGFSMGGTPWVMGFVAIQLGYIGVVALSHYRWNFYSK